MTLRLQIVLCAVLVILAVMLIRFVEKGKCNLRFVLPWFVVLFVLLLLALFPGISAFLSGAVGIAVPSNLLLFGGLGISFLLIFYLTVTVSVLSDRQRRIVQELAIQKKELDDVKRELEEIREKKGGVKAYAEKDKGNG